MPEVKIQVPRPHDKQREILDSDAKRKVIRAGRRSGKTVCVSIGAIQWFLAGKRVLYAAPTMEQVGRFWATVTRALDPLVKKKCFDRTSPNTI